MDEELIVEMADSHVLSEIVLPMSDSQVIPRLLHMGEQDLCIMLHTLEISPFVCGLSLRQCQLWQCWINEIILY